MLVRECKEQDVDVHQSNLNAVKSHICWTLTQITTILTLTVEFFQATIVKLPSIEDWRLPLLSRLANF